MYILCTRTPSLLDTIYYSHEYPRGANYSLANCVVLTGVQQLEARDTYNILGEIGEKTIGVTPPTTTKLQLCCLGGNTLDCKL